MPSISPEVVGEVLAQAEAQLALLLQHTPNRAQQKHPTHPAYPTNHAQQSQAQISPEVVGEVLAQAEAQLALLLQHAPSCHQQTMLCPPCLYCRPSLACTIKAQTVAHTIPEVVGEVLAQAEAQLALLLGAQRAPEVLRAVVLEQGVRVEEALGAELAPWVAGCVGLGLCGASGLQFPREQPPGLQ